MISSGLDYSRNVSHKNQTMNLSRHPDEPNDALPAGFSRPYPSSYHDVSLFQLPMAEALLRLSVSHDDLHRWRTAGWLSFSWQPDDVVDELGDPKLHEIELIRDLTRRGLPDAWITHLLSSLPRPLSHPPSHLAYHFRHGWIAADAPAEVEPAEVTEEYISALIVDGDRETLQSLQQQVTEALERISEEESKTS
jgi:hypothetical protein